MSRKKSVKQGRPPLSLPPAIGDRVLIIGNHPWAGHSGEYIENRNTMFGQRPVVRLETGDECFVMNGIDWMRFPTK